MTMASPERVTDRKLEALKINLEELPISIRGFSLAMRSLYTEKALGGSSQTSRDFQKLRDDSRNDAMVYLNGILPVTTKFISNLQEFFEHYTAMTYDEWKEYLIDIINETEEHKQVANALVELHKGMLVNLKKRQDSAKVILKSMKNLTAEFERKSKELEALANVKRNWAIGLAFVPFVNVIASPLLAVAANDDMASSIAQCEEAKIGEAAALTVEQTLIPALNAFIQGIESATGFLNILHQELIQYHNQGEKALEEPKKKHFITMRSKAEGIISGCLGFYGVLPSVQTDFDAIPREGTDKNYVDRWLEQQKQIIREKITIKSAAAKCIKYFSQLTL